MILTEMFQMNVFQHDQITLSNDQKMINATMKQTGTNPESAILKNCIDPPNKLKS